MAVDFNGNLIVYRLGAEEPLFSAPHVDALNAYCGATDDGHVIWANGDNEKLKRWNAADFSRLEDVSNFLTDTSPVRILSHDGKRMFEAGSSEMILTDIASKTVKWRMDIDLLFAKNAAFSPDDNLIIVGSTVSSKLVSTTDGEIIRDLKAKNEVHGTAFSADGKLLITGDWDNGVFIWNDQGELVKTLKASSLPSPTIVGITSDDMMVVDVGGTTEALDLQNSTLKPTGGVTRNAAAMGKPIRPLLLYEGASAGETASVSGPFAREKVNDIQCVVSHSVAFEICAGLGRFERQNFGERNKSALAAFAGTRRVTALALSMDDRLIGIGTQNGDVLVCHSAGTKCSLEAHAFSWRGGHHAQPWVSSIGFSADGRFLVATSEESNSGILIDLKTKTVVDRWGGSGLAETKWAFSLNGSIFARGEHGGVLTIRLGDNPAIVPLVQPEIERWSPVAFSPDDKEVASVRTDGMLVTWEVNGGARTHLVRTHSGRATAIAYDPEGAFLWSSGEDGTLHLWRRHRNLSSLGSFAMLPDGSSVFVGNDGRFDTTSPDLATPLRFIFKDDPLRLLPPELFVRDYFEPRLLSRLIRCQRLRASEQSACTDAFKPVRSIASLNRVQPDVKIADVRRGTEADDVIVRVEVAGGDDPSQTNGKTRTDAYDLRLFRDGELVGQWPQASDSSDKIEAWRQRTHLQPDAGANIVSHEFVVKLPTRLLKENVLFTAYVFNEDRVKSATAPLDYRVPKDITPREARAYVLTIGINSYDAPARQLRFAVRDADAMGESLSKLGGYQVVPVSLTSDGRDRTKWLATKANFLAVLARLAGRPTPPGSLSGVHGADQLARATPDDVLVITFSGHGYTAKSGAFYLLPSDSGTDLDIGPEAPSNFISSQEISERLRLIDAGQMAMIIDACHSAASVDQPGFKPGPMGDRGLGQLAYDKAMRILAASQADDVALESEKLKQGLLTYALVHDGLALGPDGKRAADANHDGKLTLAEWLRYGEQHTPSLFKDIMVGRKEPVYIGRDPVIPPGFKERVIAHAQTPSLFDFARADPVTLSFGEARSRIKRPRFPLATSGAYHSPRAPGRRRRRAPGD